MGFYLDTSILLSAFVTDAKSKAVESWMLETEGVLSVSTWAAAEFYAAVHRRARRGEYSSDDATEICRDFQKWQAANSAMVDVSPAAGSTAVSLCENAALKLSAADALHLALAISNELPFVTTDLRLADAARSRNHPCVVP